jgi:hypothetical protein
MFAPVPTPARSRPHPPRGATGPLSWCVAVMLAAGGLAGCNAKVNECNRLIDAVKAHTAELSAAIEKLGEIQSNPAVADDFTKSIKAAESDIAALQFSDSSVAGFAKQYLDLLAEADRVNQSMAAAAKTNDREALDRAAGEAEKVVTLEESIVKGVNEYCQG